MPYYLGIDGGATKTTAAIASDERVLGVATSGGSNLNRTGEAQVRASLHTAIHHACRIAGVTPAEINFACIGAAGASRSEISDKVLRIVGEIVPAKSVIMGDMAIAHASVFFGSPGIVVISGTGSIAFGCNRHGEVARAGGWGSAISDEGSGYWIGRRAVSAALRAYDERKTTALIASILQSWHLSAPEEMSRIAGSTPPPNYSELFPAVQAAAENGDAVAGAILTDAGVELARLANILMSRLWSGGEAVNVGMIGGVFRHSPNVRQAFYNSVKAERAAATVRFSTMQPVLGAIHLARKLALETKSTVEAGGVKA